MPLYILDTVKSFLKICTFVKSTLRFTYYADNIIYNEKKLNWKNANEKNVLLWSQTARASAFAPRISKHIHVVTMLSSRIPQK